MWGDAYLEQARSDWKAYIEIQKLLLDGCHKLYYLRATTEKLGKAALLKGGTHDVSDLSKKHKVFVKYLQISTKNLKLCKTLGIHPSQLKPYIEDILPLANCLQNLAPGEGNYGPNAEYPWETSGKVFAPASYKFPEIAELSSSSNGRKLLQLVRSILEKFEAVY